MPLYGVVKCKREMIETSVKVAEAPHLANRLTDHQKQDVGNCYVFTILS